MDKISLLFPFTLFIFLRDALYEVLEFETACTRKPRPISLGRCFFLGHPMWIVLTNQLIFVGIIPLSYVLPPFTFSFYSIKRRTSNLGPVAFLWRRAAQPPCWNFDIKEAVFRNSSSEKLGLGCASCGRFSDSIGWLPPAQTDAATSPRTGMIIPARWVYIHPWMSSGTLHFPAILVTVTCNPRRCVRTPWSGRERKDFIPPPWFQTQEFTFPYEHSVHI